MPLKILFNLHHFFIRKKILILKFLKTEDGKTFKGRLKDFFFDITINGLFLNYTFTILFSMPLEFYSFPAYGFAWWYIKEEVPMVINKLKDNRGL